MKKCFFFGGKKRFLVNRFLVPTVTIVTTVTTETTATIVTIVTTIIVEYQMLLFYSSKGNFFTKVIQPTNQQTTRLLELLSAAKHVTSHGCNENFSCGIYYRLNVFFLYVFIGTL